VVQVILESGEVGRQANGAILIRDGETVRTFVALAMSEMWGTHTLAIFTYTCTFCFQPVSPSHTVSLHYVSFLETRTFFYLFF
jgi:hypothetical protein